MNEKDYYDAILSWFKRKRSYTPVGKEYKLEGLGLLTADVLAQKDSILVACELKNSPFPVGSQGWGSIGQALALRRKANYIYVGCVASDDLGSKKNSWKLASGKRTVRNLLDYLKIPQPESYEDYVHATQRVFTYFFADLGLGLLVVHELVKNSKSKAELKVEEVVSPVDTHLAI